MRRVEHYTMESFASPSNRAQKRKRDREVTACRTCRLRKVACDRQRPCNNCTSRGFAAECSYEYSTSDETMDTQLRGASDDASDLAPKELSVDSRLHRIETGVTSLAQKLESFIQHTEAALDEPDRAHRNSMIRPLRSTSNPYARAALDGNKVHGATFHVGLYHWVHPFSQDMGYLRTSNRFAKQWSNVQSLTARFKPIRRMTLWEFSQPTGLTEISETYLRGLLPEQAVAHAMLTRFLLTFNETHPIVDGRVFLAEVNAFWKTRSPNSAAWIALYLSIISIGFQLPVIAIEDGQVLPEGRIKGKELMQTVTRSAIMLAQTAKRPNLTIFQTLLVSVLQQKLDLDWVDGSDLTNGLLGLLSRMAASLGLHRDPAIAPSIEAREGLHRRNVYWTFVFIDMEHSLQCGAPFHWRREDSDVEHVQSEYIGWKRYRKYITGLIPICATLMQISNSKYANASDRKLEDIRKDLANLREEHLVDEPEDPMQGQKATPRIIRAIQKALCTCFDHRIRIFLEYPHLDSVDPQRRCAAANQIRDCSLSMHESGHQIMGLILTAPKDSHSAWAHFTACLLRCQFSYASSAGLLALNKAAKERSDVDRESQTISLLSKIKTVHRFFEDAWPVSFEFTKQQILYRAQYHAAEERIYRYGETDVADGDSPDSLDDNISLTVQQTIDSMVQKATVILEKARRSEDPPPNLLLHPEVPSGVPAGETPSGSEQDTQTEGMEIPEWLDMFDDWFIEPGGFGEHHFNPSSSA